MARTARSAVDTGFIVYNERNLSEPDRAVPPPRRADPGVRHVVRGVAARRRAGICRHRPARACSPSGATCCVRASGRCCATCCASIARRRATSAPRRESLRCGLSRRARLRRGASSTTTCCRWPPRSGPPPAPPSATIRPRLHPLLRQPRPAAAARPAGLAHRRRRQPPLCRRLTAPFAHSIRLGCGVHRAPPGDRWIVDCRRARPAYDHVVIATHPDQALAMLSDRSPAERRCSARSATAATRRCCTRDPSLMPRRRAVWSSWNYLGGGRGSCASPIG